MNIKAIEERDKKRLLEALQEREGCKGYGIACQKCRLREKEYFVIDNLTGIKFGIKASICSLLNLVEYLLKHNEEEDEADKPQRIVFH